MNSRRRCRLPIGPLGCFFWLAAFSGCLANTLSQTAAPPVAPPKPELLCERQGAERIETANFRGGKAPEVVKVFHKNPDGNPPLFMSCKEVDVNGDGRKDMLVYLDKNGRKTREEFDHDKDGVADQKSHYEGGALVRDELDSNSDGKIDIIEHFSDGKRMRVERIVPAKPAEPSATGTSAQAGDTASAKPPTSSAPPTDSSAKPVPPTDSSAKPVSPTDSVAKPAASVPASSDGKN